MDEKEKNKKEGTSFEERMGPFRAAAKYLNIPFTLLSTTIVGALIGYFLESRWPTGGIFIMVFCMLGVAAGFREIIRSLKKPDEKKKNDE